MWDVQGLFPSAFNLSEIIKLCGAGTYLEVGGGYMLGDEYELTLEAMAIDF